MTGTPKSEGARGRRGDGATRLRSSAFTVIVACVLALATISLAHEPITTKVRFNKEVIRILQRSCLGCHRPGGIAFSLATYDEARPWAKAIKEEVLEKRMPPWHAVKGYGEFRNAPSFTQRDIDLLVNWVEGGAPKGDEKDLPAGPLFSDDWQLGKPDLALKPEGEFEIAANADEYRSFVLATNLKEDRWMTAIDLRPRNGSIVHSAKFYLLSGREAHADSKIMQINKHESAQPDLRFEFVEATWMPGLKTTMFDDGVAQLIGAGSRIGVTIRYHGSEEAVKDLPEVGLYFAKSRPTKSVNYVAITGADSVIPADDRPVPRKATFTTKSDRDAVGIRPFVHPLVISLQATAYRPDGSREVLIWTRGYQFDWEPTYYFKRPISLPKGTRVEIVTYFDNSENNPNNPNTPPKSVRWSEIRGLDPWCVFLLADPTQ